MMLAVLMLMLLAMLLPAAAELMSAAIMNEKENA